MIRWHDVAGRCMQVPARHIPEIVNTQNSRNSKLVCVRKPAVIQVPVAIAAAYPLHGGLQVVQEKPGEDEVPVVGVVGTEGCNKLLHRYHLLDVCTVALLLLAVQGTVKNAEGRGCHRDGQTELDVEGLTGAKQANIVHGVGRIGFAALLGVFDISANWIRKGPNEVGRPVCRGRSRWGDQWRRRGGAEGDLDGEISGGGEEVQGRERERESPRNLSGREHQH
ncbi:hypothetical protein Taro_029424 [Colocasia esculenta]|uniref:Uncharacterized protein n=1 Tax=Colocasia esculenta TaxID=4460 RepID=A0A843VLC0_COLES|nr:hypothetical protein [Colocasia esculenta]